MNNNHHLSIPAVKPKTSRLMRMDETEISKELMSPLCAYLLL
jgi:hypothetical protein